MTKAHLVLRIFFLIVLTGAVLKKSTGQERVTTFGIQCKPMFPSKFFGTSEQSFVGDVFSVNFIPVMGYNFGMVIRKGMTKKLSLETGINSVQRNFRIEFLHPVLREKETLNYRLVGYEIPVLGLIYVRLGEHLWMNASGGLSIDMYPSNVKSSASTFVDSLSINITQITVRQNWIQPALLANYGFEWRTQQSGLFYLGASFHRPFSDIALTRANITIDNVPSSLFYSLSGAYLTVDLKYFFPENTSRANKKKFQNETLN